MMGRFVVAMRTSRGAFIHRSATCNEGQKKNPGFPFGKPGFGLNRLEDGLKVSRFGSDASRPWRCPPEPCQRELRKPVPEPEGCQGCRRNCPGPFRKENSRRSPPSATDPSQSSWET